MLGVWGGRILGSIDPRRRTRQHLSVNVERRNCGIYTGQTDLGIDIDGLGKDFHDGIAGVILLFYSHNRLRLPRLLAPGRCTDNAHAKITYLAKV